MNQWVGILFRQDGVDLELGQLNDNGWNSFSFPFFVGYYRKESRFINDQLFRKNEKTILFQDGIILNLSELKKEIAAESVEEIVSKLGIERFIDSIIGPNCGIHYNAELNELIAYTNQTGDAPLFYFENHSFLIVSNDFNLIFNILVSNKIAYEFDENAATALMSYGYMIDDSTMIKSIKRISAGHYLLFKNNSCEMVEYHHFRFEDSTITYDDVIERLDDLFTKAVKRCFEKDREYDTHFHLADMSGGMDSRMTNWVAHELGYRDVVNINYCQSGSDELKCASKASSVLGNQFLHKQLDDHSFVYEIDDIIDMNYGLAVYFGITGGKQLLSQTNQTLFGLEHSGQLGDVVVGNYGNTDKHVPVQQKSFRYSALIDFSVPQEVINKYKNNEEFGFYCRGFRGILSSHLLRRHYYYTVSPFLDPELMSFCFSIPMKYRFQQKLYWDWVDKKHEEAGKVISTRKRPQNPYRQFCFRLFRRSKSIYKRTARQLHLARSANEENLMNPFDYWWETDSNLRDFVKQYYCRNIYRAEQYPTVKMNVDKLYYSKKVVDKLLAINILGVLKRYFEK